MDLHRKENIVQKHRAEKYVGSPESKTYFIARREIFPTVKPLPISKWTRSGLGPAWMDTNLKTQHSTSFKIHKPKPTQTVFHLIHFLKAEPVAWSENEKSHK